MKRIIYILIPILFASCAIVGDEPWAEIDLDDIAIETDQSSYIAERATELELQAYTFILISQFKNNSERTLYLARCRSSSVHPNYDIKLMDEESSSISAYSGFENCAGRTDPIMIHSGQARIDTLQISGPNAWENGTNEPIGVLQGTFRVVYDALTCPAGDRCEIPDSLAWSNEFEIKLAE